MSETKYEALKKAWLEFSSINQDELREVTEIISIIDKMEAAPTKNAITREEIMRVKDPDKRIQLVRENLELFQGTNNELQNKFN